MTSALELGLTPYRKAWQVQQDLHARVLAQSEESFLIMVEHPPVLTLGKHASEQNLLIPRELYHRNGIEVVEIDRGGEVTAHNPGQMVVYPILSVRQFGFTPRRYVELLETCVIDVLAGYGIDASTHPEYPGVWVKDAKVCAVGVRIKDRVTMHGIALNVSNDLTLFDTIVPCGIAGRSVTSLAMLGITATTRDVFARFVEVWCNRIGPVVFCNNFDGLIRA